MDTRITVKELKEALDNYPDDLPIEFMDEFGKPQYVDKDDLNEGLAFSTLNDSFLEVGLRFVPDVNILPDDDEFLEHEDDPEPSPPASRYNWAKAIVQ